MQPKSSSCHDFFSQLSLSLSSNCDKFHIPHLQLSLFLSLSLSLQIVTNFLFLSDLQFFTNFISLSLSLWFEPAMVMAKGTRYHKAYSNRRSTQTLILAALVMFSVMVLMLLALGMFSLPVSTTPSHEPIERTTVHLEKDGNDREERKQWTEILSWEPRAFLFHNFLSKDECEYLISLAKPHMEKSTVVDSTTGQSKDSRVRTSSGMFLKRGQDKIIQSIEKRIADFTFIPVEHGEGLQVLHYEVGQKYEPHFDYFLDEFNTKNGGQRIATVLMYLTNVEKGGETVFPSSKVNSSSVPWWDELSDCAKTGVSVRPRMGDALLFWSMRPDATLDPSSLHAGCPVIQGNKWSSTKWLHVTEYKV
ncbi:probable prolyl 4-hydroxylase 3 isoform X2 [Amborella trichopoda]|uniref:probable prolyl 4-hydroxylase 3 isoform X2 n=1 Tax=Amborella trichopoda TaxID=13333 RepID=UPI0009C00456|nr:probable prolyl 4-hydroxylase 3 isoform X2 [Amborella trichopoda]|eukprot:XP_006828848.3 probable prolyl 4-hydroxylase 3 isoform X2 [Amborella trichopoda]